MLDSIHTQIQSNQEWGNWKLYFIVFSNGTQSYACSRCNIIWSGSQEFDYRSSLPWRGRCHGSERMQTYGQFQIPVIWLWIRLIPYQYFNIFLSLDVQIEKWIHCRKNGLTYAQNPYRTQLMMRSWLPSKCRRNSSDVNYTHRMHAERNSTFIIWLIGSLYSGSSTRANWFIETIQATNSSLRREGKGK